MRLAETTARITEARWLRLVVEPFRGITAFTLPRSGSPSSTGLTSFSVVAVLGLTLVLVVVFVVEVVEVN